MNVNNMSESDLFDFLNKETPDHNGCMVCQAILENNKVQFLLIQRRKIATGDAFTINMRMFYDYYFLWQKCKGNWKILWRYDGGE